MTNLQQKIIFAFTPSPKPIYIDNKEMTNIIYSLFIADLYYNINEFHLVKRLQYFRCKYFFIINVVPFGEEKTSLLNDHVQYLPISADNPYYVKQTITFKNFFRGDYFKSAINDKIAKFNNETLNKNAIFIFNVWPLPFIIACFKLNNFILTGGANAKRGILSPVHHKLSQFLTCVEGLNPNNVYESFHNYEPLASQPIFDHTVIAKMHTVPNIGKFYHKLEEYFKLNLDIDPNIKNYPWDLKKSNDFKLNFEEFLKMYINDVQNDLDKNKEKF